MIDIVSSDPGKDLGIQESLVPRAANLLSVQLGSLFFLSEWGVDLRYFLDEPFKIENISFRSYLVESMANWGMSLSNVTEYDDLLMKHYQFDLAPDENSSGFIAR